MKLKKIIATATILVSSTLSINTLAATVNWGYTQHGSTPVVLPAAWGDYFPTCNGTSQSPIDIPLAVSPSAESLAFNYLATPLKIINNGHTIEVEQEPGSNIVLGNDEYHLLQFHFHTPSEHLVTGERFPMEMHLVHQNVNGGLAVVSVLVDQGIANPAFEKIIANAPISNGTIQVAKMFVDADELLPEDPATFYNYSGSLTTPPCSEGVRWFVMEDNIEFSAAQISAFQQIMYENARPIQDINLRTIYGNMK